MSFCSPFLFDLARPRDGFDDKLRIDLLDIVTIWISVDLKPLDDLASTLQDFPTKDPDVNMEQAKFLLPRFARSRVGIDCFD